MTVGPLSAPGDPGFLRWPTLRMVIGFGLAVGIVNGVWDAVVHGWAGVRVPWMIFTAVWAPLVLVGIHVHVQRLRRHAERRRR